MKYIDADKLIAEIERQMNECIGRFGVIHKLPEYRCLKNIHLYITSLQQEQDIIVINKKDWEAQEKFRKNKKFGIPLQQEQPCLPSNLDKAALKAYPKMSRLSEPHGVIPADNETHYLGDANEENRIAFKAGAEWMAEQGISCEAEAVKGVGISFLKGAFEKATKEFEGKVIVQIRKKEK